MAIKTIGAKLRALAKKFPERNSEGFLYRDKKDLKTRYTTVYVYAVIYDESRGHSLFVWNPHRRGHDWTWKGWNTWLNQKGIEILTGAVMQSINDKYGSEWEARQIIGFHGAVYKPVFKPASESRNKSNA